MTTYKLVKAFHPVKLDQDHKPTKRRITQRDVVAAVLTWQEAKARQRADRSRAILPERAVVAPLLAEEAA